MTVNYDKARVLREVELVNGDHVVLLDLATAVPGTTKISPRYAVYLRRGEQHLFVAGNNVPSELFGPFLDVANKIGIKESTNMQ